MAAPRSDQPVPFVGTKGAKAPNVPLNAVTIYNVETGEAATVKPINATEAVEGGYWSFEPQPAAGQTEKVAAKQPANGSAKVRKSKASKKP